MKHLTKGLYTVKAVDESSWEVTLTDETHPVFKAHFESNPLLPAFLQIDILGEILGKNLQRINRSKFKLPILPNDVVVYKVVKKIDRNYSVKIFKNSKVASEIKVVYA
jgi:3-hydroxyacyl-[acyl-carrier-protein] dehydratase